MFCKSTKLKYLQTKFENCTFFLEAIFLDFLLLKTHKRTITLFKNTFLYILTLKILYNLIKYSLKTLFFIYFFFLQKKTNVRMNNLLRGW